MKINKEQESALVGTILGDAYLQKTGEKNARLRFEHRLDHKEYLVWKTEMFPQLFQGKPTILKRVHPLTKRTYSYVRQQSNSTPYLGAMRRVFYADGIKRVPRNLNRLLQSDIGFATWFYDDGYYDARDNSLFLYLGRVTKEEAEIVQITLEKNFNLKGTIYDKKNKGFVIYFPAHTRELIKNILAKYRVPVMAYKIPS